MKVAYWPGCVSRGFTPELHGSMAQVAPLLDIELVELDRANCCGAGVIAEHNQELADTLNARTFALAQQVAGRRPDDEHLLDLPGRAERVPGAPRRERRVPRARQRDARRRAASSTAKGVTNKNFLWVLVEDIGLDNLHVARQAAADRPARSGRSTAATSCARPTASGIDAENPRDTYLAQVIEALGGTVIDYAGSAQVLRLPDHHDEQGGVAQAGRHAPRRRGRRRGRLPRHAVPAVPPEPRPPAAARRARRRPRAGHAGAAPARSSSAWRSASTPKELGLQRHVVKPTR